MSNCLRIYIFSTNKTARKVTEFDVTLVRIFLVRMHENKDHKNSESAHFSRSLRKYAEHEKLPLLTILHSE